jgi:hypothetical protein
METGRLRAAASMLEGLEAGEWLAGRLEELGSASEVPRALVIVSARRGIAATFRDGLKLCPHWVVLDPADGADAGATTAEYDLIVWGMSALKLFPADYATALDVARREKIPIWAVIVGLELLTDQQEFTERIVPRTRALLPEFSETIVCGGEEAAAEIGRLLAENGAKIARAGRLRRKTSLADGLRSRISDERLELTRKVSKTLNLMETARLGGESVKVRIRSTARDIFGDTRPFRALVDELHSKIDSVAASLPEAGDASEARRRLGQSMSGLRDGWFEGELARLANEGALKLRLWCEETTEELRKFFTPLRDAAWHGAAFERAFVIGTEEATSKLRPIFDDLGRHLCGRFDSFRAWVETDFTARLLAGFGHPAESPPPPPAPREEPLYRWQYPDEEPAPAPASRPVHNRRVVEDAPSVKKRFKRGLRNMMNHFLQATGFGELGTWRGEERPALLLTREVEALNSALVEIFDSTRERCRDVLGGIVQERADALLDHSGETLRRLNTELEKLDEAERMLPTDG